MNRRHSLPPDVYALVEQTPATVLLEGGRPKAPENNTEPHEEPWTRLFTAPLCVCTAYEVAEIPGLFAAIERAVADGHTAAGFFSYECGACFEPKAKGRQSAEHPLAWFGIYERSYAFDHATGEFADGAPPGLSTSNSSVSVQGRSSAPAHDNNSVSGQGRSSVSGHDFSRAANAANGVRALAPEGSLDTEFALAEAEFARRIAAIHEWIRAGDVYQLNFTAPFRIKALGSAAAHYARLRMRQPVAYGAFIHWQQGRHILSFSPELFFRIDEADGARRITTRPMKGTAPRGRTTREDRAIAEWLRNDPKNRSENVMIVDLLRNDLGRVARFGSVLTESLFAVERYPTLWQMTSTVTAELRPGIGFNDIFRSLFPCGSITGAPKVRAMQLISEIESQPRGVYTGAIGFFSPRQTIFNVAIRTLDLDGDHGVMGAGSGIVIDSDPQEEFRECLLKAKFLRSALQRPVGSSLPDQFSLIETLLWNGALPLLELHLDRLLDSAEYFDYPCEREVVRTALEEYAEGFERDAKRKVRLLLDGEGNLNITDEILTASGNAERIGRVRIARERTNPADPMLFHKTTHRPLYAQAFKDATAAGYDDALFLNLRGELTEGAISNIFLEKNGRWMTPPIECGLLAGVYRRHLLETRPEIEERVLYEADLRAADAVYLVNALRGLRRVTIDWDSSDPA